jgi:Skp family chaperone for outer membrane proteins
MKSRIAALVFFWFCAWTPAGVAAQEGSQTATKIAFVNTTGVLQGTGEGRRELTSLEEFINERQRSLETERVELEELRRQFDSQVRMLNPDTASEMRRTVTEKERRVQRSQEDTELDINRRRNELLARMSEKIQTVIAEYAQQNGFGAVFMETPALPYYSPTLDITDDIIRVYDQKHPVPGAPPAPTPQPSPGAAPMP